MSINNHITRKRLIATSQCADNDSLVRYILQAVRVDASAPLLLRGRRSASRAVEQMQRSRSYAQYVLTVTDAPASRVKAAVSKAAW